MMRSPRSIEDYDALFNPVRNAREDKRGKHNGDPDRAAVVILGLVTRCPPQHLLLGSDALTLVKPALPRALDEIDVWEKISRSKDFKNS